MLALNLLIHLLPEGNCIGAHTYFVSMASIGWLEKLNRTCVVAEGGGSIKVAQESCCVESPSATPGWRRPLSNVGVVPSAQTQSGSPNSIPFVSPSPSESFKHNSFVHCLFCCLKSLPKSFVSPPPLEEMCPTPGYLLPLGILVWYSLKAVTLTEKRRKRTQWFAFIFSICGSAGYGRTDDTW